MTHLPALAAGVLVAFLLPGLGGCSTRSTYREFRSDEPAYRPAATAPQGDLRIMSANVRHALPHDLPNIWTARRDVLMTAIRQFNPDILGTQEPVLSQTVWLARQMPEYVCVGRGRREGQASGEMSVIFFKRSRLEALDSGEFWLSRTPEKAGTGSWGAWVPRMCNWVKLAERRGARREFYVFNTHFAAFSDHARTKAAQLLRNRIADIAGNSPIIVTGDFNSDELEQPYHYMTRRYAGVALRDTYRLARPRRGDDEKTYHAFLGGDQGRRIDWILACDRFRTLAAGIDHTHTGVIYPSDHYPVTAILNWSVTSDVYLTAAQSEAQSAVATR